jgi:hypothetical protein
MAEKSHILHFNGIAMLAAFAHKDKVVRDCSWHRLRIEFVSLRANEMSEAICFPPIYREKVASKPTKVKKEIATLAAIIRIALARSDTMAL